MPTDNEDIDLFQSMIKRVLEQEVAPYYTQWESAAAIPKTLWQTLEAAGGSL